MASWPVSAEVSERTPALRPVSVRLVARDWRELTDPAMQGQWDALAEWAAEPNPFFESWYLLPALRGFDPHGRARLLCLEADGQLAGLMPLRRDWTYYQFPIPAVVNLAPCQLLPRRPAGCARVRGGVLARAAGLG